MDSCYALFPAKRYTTTEGYLPNPSSAWCPASLHFNPTFQEHCQMQGGVKPPLPTAVASRLLFGSVHKLALTSSRQISQQILSKT